MSATNVEIIRAVVIVADHYGLKVVEVQNFNLRLFRVMVRHIATARPCDHPGGRPE